MTDRRPATSAEPTRGSIGRFLLSDLLGSTARYALVLAVAVWIQERTGSTSSAATAMLFIALGGLLAPVGGAVADRVSPSSAYRWASLGTAAILPVLVVRGVEPVLPAVYVVGFVYGFAATVAEAAQASLIAGLVEEERLVQVNAWHQTISRGLRVGAPLLGVGVLVSGGMTVNVVLVMGLFAGAALVVPSLPRVAEASVPWRLAAIASEVSTGLRRLLRDDPELRMITVGAAFALLFLSFFEAVGLQVVTEGLGRPASFLAVLVAVQGACVVLSGLALARFGTSFRESSLLLGGIACFALSALLQSTAALALVYLGVAVAGVGLPWCIVASTTALQRRTPREDIGKAYGAMALVVGIPQSAGVAGGALLTTVAGPRTGCLVIALGLAAVASGWEPPGTIPGVTDRRARGEVFRYTGFTLDEDGTLTCSYELDDETFTERFECGPGDYAGAGAQAVARLVFLLAGISYYKTGAPPLIEGPADGLTDRERSFLRDYYLNGLAEFSHTDGHDLSDLRIAGPSREAAPVVADVEAGRPLIPFGGGIDSVVVVEQVREVLDDIALFVANTSDVPFAPIEDTVAVAGLPVQRARRHLDPKVLESRQRGYFNGHVPVTGIISALALLVAVANRRDAVVMSNEHSASEPTGMVANGVPVNHQWSKSLAFESAFREVLAESVTGLDYFSALRPYSELWVSRRFAALTGYHLAFRSCNKAFYVDASSRLAQWCGECDKCCFIDLILSPYLEREHLEQIFNGREPLGRADLEPEFRSLLGEPGRSKPLECVGDEGECRRAVLLAASREDRAGSDLLASLAAYVEGAGMPVPTEETLLHRQGPHFIPAALPGDSAPGA